MHTYTNLFHTYVHAHKPYTNQHVYELLNPISLSTLTNINLKGHQAAVCISQFQQNF